MSLQGVYRDFPTVVRFRNSQACTSCRSRHVKVGLCSELNCVLVLISVSVMLEDQVVLVALWMERHVSI